MQSLNSASPSGLPNLPSSRLPTVEILELRTDYRSCHIVLPDSNERTAAIALAGEYYSFFRVEKSEARAQSICAKLMQRGHRPVITRVPKGFVVWTLEPNAQLATQTTSARLSDTSSSLNSSTGAPSEKAATDAPVAPYRILVSPDQYKFCNIRVPDLDKRLMAICVDGLFYSLFKTLEDVQQAVQIVKKLNYRGNETIITKNAKGYSLWVLEPDARMD
ncbi:hypothetical protein HNI00_05680 [Thermoleptolyngbya oregonensis NK1-22]|uniref:Uncharacterized protein n=1 Tax=Thermoleptolyngbya oregonensis NK1-22 TaxID=2547457 RepID=A0AA96Y7T5_9CYAN|nr:hypothetical protein [Thermoleptolyngbya oregonensis]WOB42698.1 hypothetical protein HNI00_05680 [Thermoleptolyngbya oregonensis NK1-22]